jgi:hypothetical protein
MTWYFSRRRNETQRRFSELSRENLSDTAPGGSGYLGLTRRWFTRAYWEREAEANILSDTIKTRLQDLESQKQTVAQEQKALQEVLGNPELHNGQKLRAFSQRITSLVREARLYSDELYVEFANQSEQLDKIKDNISNSEIKLRDVDSRIILHQDDIKNNLQSIQQNRSELKRIKTVIAQPNIDNPMLDVQTNTENHVQSTIEMLLESNTLKEENVLKLKEEHKKEQNSIKDFEKYKEIHSNFKDHLQKEITSISSSIETWVEEKEKVDSTLQIEVIDQNLQFLTKLHNILKPQLEIQNQLTTPQIDSHSLEDLHRWNKESYKIKRDLSPLTDSASSNINTLINDTRDTIKQNWKNIKSKLDMEEYKKLKDDVKLAKDTYSIIKDIKPIEELSKDIEQYRIQLSTSIFVDRYETKSVPIDRDATIIEKLGYENAREFTYITTMLQDTKDIPSYALNPYYVTYYHQKYGAVLIARCYKDDDREWGKNNKREPLPYSDLVINQLLKAIDQIGQTEESIPHLLINEVAIDHISNIKTKMALGKYLNDEFEQDFTPDHEDFEKVVLQTPFCKSLQYQLEQYKHTIGKKKINRVKIWRRPEQLYAFNMKIVLSEDDSTSV